MAQELNFFFTVAASSLTFFLGFIVAFHDLRSATNRIFLLHACTGAIWAAVNYMSLTAPTAEVLFWIRAVIFLAVPHVFLFFLFVWNFPNERLAVPANGVAALLVNMGLMMGLAASPWVFESAKFVGDSVVPVPGPLMVVFSPMLILFFFATIGLLIRKYMQAEGNLLGQWRSIGLGFGAAYVLLLFFVLLRVSIWDDVTFVPYSPLFILPIFAGSAYAIFRHELFNIKVIAAETLTFVLILLSLIQVLLAGNAVERIVSGAVTVLTLVFGILLVRSVLREVKQREELEVLYQKVEELSRFKTQLLSLASHQIKSPLAAIKGFATLMEEGMYGATTGEQKGAIAKIRKAANELMDLINTLLDLRKVEEGRMEYDFQPANLVELTADVVSGLEPLAREKHIQFGFFTPAKTIPVRADAVKLAQVVRNLVDNAIKYTPSGFVKVDLRLLGEDVILCVSDSGMGISPELLPHLFEEFVRDEQAKKKVLGTGLGLFIAKKIVEAHGGSIWAESAGEGKGSTFWAKLPLAPSAA